MRGAMNIDAVEDWLRIRRDLLETEAAFTTLAIKVANRQESEARLQQEREHLEAMRAQCSAAYRRAFPETPSSAGPGGSGSASAT
jgi:site-specific recombinase